mmetsp:Transcript_29374/g.69837  ORF Transcript_29374/g.69837 Transcript_29374/m.69837 type:complete len:396 (-) Transcript_29374:230-1417(-)
MERSRHVLQSTLSVARRSVVLNAFAPLPRSVHTSSAAAVYALGGIRLTRTCAPRWLNGALPAVTATFVASRPGSTWAVAVRHLSSEPAPGAAAAEAAEPKEDKKKAMFLLLSGSKEPQPIQISLDDRVIVALEATAKVLEAELQKQVQGIVMALNDKGNYEIRWPKGADDDVASYILAHEYSAVEAGYEYQGAFAIGVKRVKMLSLASLLFTSLGGPLLVIGEANPSPMQYGMCVAIIFFGVSTTGLLHLITSPYVVALRRLADKSFEAETPLLSGGTATTRFLPEHVQPSGAPFATFTAKGRKFFIHKELFIGDEAQGMLWDLLGPGEVEAMYEAQLAKDPEDPDALYNYGRFLWLVKHDATAAATAIDKVLALDSDDKGAMELLAHIKAGTPP